MPTLWEAMKQQPDEYPTDACTDSLYDAQSPLKTGARKEVYKFPSLSVAEVDSPEATGDDGEVVQQEDRQ